MFTEHGKAEESIAVPFSKTAIFASRRHNTWIIERCIIGIANTAAATTLLLQRVALKLIFQANSQYNENILYSKTLLYLLQLSVKLSSVKRQS